MTARLQKMTKNFQTRYKKAFICFLKLFRPFDITFLLRRGKNQESLFSGSRQ